MGFLIGLLIVLMLLDCAILILLVLVQLPKKEAGAGLAFGGAAADALLGAGSGTTLTKITRWAATIFFLMAVILSALMNHYYRPGSSGFERNLSRAPAETTPAVAPAPGASTAPPAISANTNFQLSTSNASLLSATNALPAAGTNPPAESPANPSTPK